MNEFTPMHRTILSITVLSIATVSLTGCQDPITSQQPPGEHETHRHALAADHMHERVDSEDVLLDHVGSNPGEALIARTEPVKEGTDAYRTMVIASLPERLERAGIRIAPGERVLDAQFTEDGVVVLGADHVLRYHERGMSEARELARNALGPLSVARGKVAYVHGEPPDLVLAVADLGTGESTPIAPSLTTVWSPALSEDGDAVIFVASHEGRPHLFRADLEGKLESIPTGLRTPSAPVAPIWDGDALIFQDERGVVRFDLETASIEAEFRGAKFLPADDAGHIYIEEHGTRRLLQDTTARRGDAR